MSLLEIYRTERAVERNGHEPRPSEKTIFKKFDEIDMTPAKICRVTRKKATIKQLAANLDHLEAPKIMYANDEEKWVLVAGYYRVLAMKKKRKDGTDFINAGSGTMTKIMDAAIKDNTKHGERYSRQDIRQMWVDWQARHPNEPMRKFSDLLGRDYRNVWKTVNDKRYPSDVKVSIRPITQLDFVSHGVLSMSRSSRYILDRLVKTLSLKPFAEWTDRSKATFEKMRSELIEALNGIK